MPPGGDSGCSGNLITACSVGAGDIVCSVGTALGVSVPLSIGGDGFYFSGAVLVLKKSANCSTEVAALGPYSKKGVVGTGLKIIVMRSRIASVDLSYDYRAGIVTLLGNNWTVSEIRSIPVVVI